jgi:quercetin dioxygenase-like cupin family protein
MPSLAHIDFNCIECHCEGVADNLVPSTGLRVVTPEQWGSDLGLVRGGSWRTIVGAGNPAACRTLHELRFAPDSATPRLSHPVEAVYYVDEGTATVTEQVASGSHRHPLGPGSMFHAHAGAVYEIESGAGARLLGGPSPVDPRLGADAAEPGERALVSTYHRDRPGLLVPFISRDARLVVWLGVGAVTANMNYVVLEPGERNKEHVHAFSEDTVHILAGHGTAENVTTGESFAFGPGDTIHIEIGIWHAVAADRGERVVSVGGPCPADTDMLRVAGVDVDGLLASLGQDRIVSP